MVQLTGLTPVSVLSDAPNVKISLMPHHPINAGLKPLSEAECRALVGAVDPLQKVSFDAAVTDVTMHHLANIVVAGRN